MKSIQRFIKSYFWGLHSKKECEAQLDEWSKAQNRSEITGAIDELWLSTSKQVVTTESDRAIYRKEAKRLLRKMNKETEPASDYIRIPLRWVKYASVAAVLIACIFSVSEWMERYDSTNIQMLTVVVPYGTNKQVELPDKTKVTLHAGSKLSYPERFVGDTRQVQLDGEGYFDVTPNKFVPFEIATDSSVITVVGTSFNVKAFGEDEQMNVCVATGRVQVALPDGLVGLNVDEQIVYDKSSGDFIKKTEKSQNAAAWMDGGLYFYRTPLKSVANELRRQYNVEITLASNVGHESQIFGEFKSKDLNVILDAVCYATGLKYRKIKSGIVIYKP